MRRNVNPPRRTRGRTRSARAARRLPPASRRMCFPALSSARRRRGLAPGPMVRKRIVVAALALVLASGCGWWSEQGRTTKGAAYGTGAGAATGAAIGAALGGGEGAWKGAAVGAALGALGGGLIGHYMDNQAKEMQKVVDRQDRVERDGESLRLSLASDVLFDSGSATLQPGAEDKLQHV